MKTKILRKVVSNEDGSTTGVLGLHFTGVSGARAELRKRRKLERKNRKKVRKLNRR